MKEYNDLFMEGNRKKMHEVRENVKQSHEQELMNLLWNPLISSRSSLNS